ncbi:glycosyltransferase 87 family protein [Micromonospora cathayae]|uniref:Glycosyltransferase 87 family protein n=1 Tax=Micromonospora cathayae TaxID=3028804 RepID=A0ABY7ZKK6_9ACTN|nr:glycosyltransferase 87 family protein [Micromonospora sp. HUAS 3]WDZ83525.1 glycosyltransferase 87 family protein [Micromonospora sp. HUAS 3]
MSVLPRTPPRVARRGRAVPVGGVLLFAVGGTAATIAVVWWVAAHTGSAWSPGGDLAVYRDAAQAVRAGGSPYQVDRDGYGFVYPPFAALVLTPLAVVGPLAGYAIWTVLSTLAVPAVVWLLVDHLTPAGDHRRPTLLAVGTLAALPLSPIAGTLLLGNVNIVLLALVLVDLLRVRGPQQGILLGVAAGIKLTPLVFVVHLLLTGRIRAGVTALASFVGTVGVGALVLPADSVTFWAGVLDSSRTRPPGEEAYGGSIRGAVLHLLPEAAHGVWLPVSVLAAAAGLAVAVWASRRHEELTAILACAVTGLLVSPVTWYAHWVWSVPVLALLVARTWRRPAHRRWPAGLLWLVFALPLPWWVGYVLGWAPLTEPAWMMPVDLLYTVTAVALLVLAAVWLRRTAPAARGCPR